MSATARPATVPIVQLPVDLQNQIRSGAGLSTVSHALGGQSPASLALGALIVVATAATVSGVVAVLRYPAASFEEPRRWLPLVAGALTLGAVFGALSRLDFRPKGIRALVVGPTSLVIVRRDTVRVFPAEGVTRGPRSIVFAGKHIDTSFQTSDFTAALDRARSNASDPVARASDRWRAAAVGRPAPFRPWMPIAHGAVFAVAVALALEAAFGTAATVERQRGWDALEDRAGDMHVRIGKLREGRIATAIAGGPRAIVARLKTPDGQDAEVAKQLAAALNTQLRERIDAAKSPAALDEPLAVALEVAAMPEIALAPDVVERGRTRFKALVADVAGAELLASLKRARKLGIDVGITALERADQLLLVEATALPRGDAAALEQFVGELHRILLTATVPNALAPLARTRKVLEARAEEVVAKAELGSYAFLFRASTVPVVTEKAVRTALARSQSFDELAAIRNAAQRVNITTNAEAYAARVFAAQLRDAKTPDDLSSLAGDSEDFGDFSAQITTRATAMIAATRDFRELSEWAGSNLFEDDEFILARADALALAGTTTEAHAYLAIYRFSSRDAADGVRMRIEAKCGGMFRGDGLKAQIGRELCKESDRVLTYDDSAIVTEQALVVDVARQLAAELTRMSGGDRMVVETRSESDGLVTINLEVDRDALGRVATTAVTTGKPQRLACPATIELRENPDVTLKQTYTCTVGEP